ncbi:hypothetical protein ACFY7C_35410 [Streptomyces sp. NPDC012769]|uniref:hypothetical protein n=1 Tax=Streptomyces sp. NPDC012769 TaxID=3364848 RepID=UPI00367BBD6E
MHNDRHDEPLSDDELKLFIQYLHRFANHDVDIFAQIEAGYPEHPVYVLFGRDYPPIGEASDYHRPFTSHRTPTSTADINDGG